MGNKITYSYEKTTYLPEGTSIQDVMDTIKENINKNKHCSIVDKNEVINSMFERKPLDKDDVEQSEKILYVLWTSRLWKFVDDIVFMIGDNNGKRYITAKSTSRKGQYDFGQNKKHITILMKQLKF